MDYYPPEIRDGVRPLIYVVDAIDHPLLSSSPSTNNKNTTIASSTETTDDGIASTSNDDTTTTASTSLAGGDTAGEPSKEQQAKNEAKKNTKSHLLFERFVKVLSGTNDINNSTTNNTTSSTSTTPNDKDKINNTTNDESPSDNITTPIEFFQRAKIVSVSRRHAFPPSKDPNGTNNRVVQISRQAANTSTNTSSINTRIYTDVPTSSSQRTSTDGTNNTSSSSSTHSTPSPSIVNGILPAGWIEKHAHALPSVLILVTVIDTTTTTESSLSFSLSSLYDTLDTLRSSLATKRDCRIHLACLRSWNDDESSPSSNEEKLAREHEWLAAVRSRCRLPPSAITVLGASDVTPAGAALVASPLHRLHRNVRDASLSYYLNQARRAKRKHTSLGYDASSSLIGKQHSSNPELLPLSARYCFKIGLFYEFQDKSDKTEKYFQEAYRNVEGYYKFLMRVREEAGLMTIRRKKSVRTAVLSGGGTEEGRGEGKDGKIGEGGKAAEETDDTEGVEVALLASPTAAQGSAMNTADDDTHTTATTATSSSSLMPPPSLPRNTPTQPAPNNNNNTSSLDLTHQCRSMAEYLHVKLLQLYFRRSDNVSISQQYRRHSQIFFVDYDGGDDQPRWRHLVYLLRQRVVMGELLEEYHGKMRKGGEVLSVEVTMRLSSWRIYLAAAECALELRLCLRGEEEALKKLMTTVDSSSSSPMQKFVGSVDNLGLKMMLKEELSKDYLLIVRGYLETSLRLFHRENNDNDASKDNDNVVSAANSDSMTTTRRSSARIYYLLGGVLLQINDPRNAYNNLKMAEAQCPSWPTLTLSIKTIMLRCLDLIASNDDNFVTEERTRLLLSIALDVSLSSLLSSHERMICYEAVSQKALVPREINVMLSSPSDRTLPVSYTLTFPFCTHAIAGDVIVAQLSLISNLSITLPLEGVTLETSMGDITVDINNMTATSPADDKNKNKKQLFLIPHTPQLFSVTMTIPSYFTTSTVSPPIRGIKRYTSGLTTAGGACLLLHDTSSTDSSKTNNPTTTTTPRFLGGTPLSCHGIKCSVPFGCLHLSSPSTQPPPPPPTTSPPPSTRSILIDEENYLTSTYSSSSPLLSASSLGPRLLRVMEPSPQLHVTNVTESISGGRVMDGCVNRVLLWVRPGMDEVCHDVKYSVTSSHVLRKRIGGDGIDETKEDEEDEDDEDEKDGSENDDGKGSRYPRLVIPTTISDNDNENDDSLSVLPPGWKTRGGNGLGRHELTDVIDTLPPEGVYIPLDFYRSSSRRDATSNDAEEEEDDCRTDYEVVITYKQERGTSSSSREVMEGSTSEVSRRDRADTVMYYHRGSVEWYSPIRMTCDIARGAEKAYPCGTLHESNKVDSSQNNQMSPSDERKVTEMRMKRGSYESSASSWSRWDSDTLGDDEGGGEVAVVDGELVRVKCMFRPGEVDCPLGVMVERVEFVNESQSPQGQLELQTCDTTNPNLLYSPPPNDKNHAIKSDSHLAISYTVKTNLSTDRSIWSHFITDAPPSYPTSLGTVSITVSPLPLPPPPPLTTTTEEQDATETLCHGPLPSTTQPITLHFSSPHVSLSHAPFSSTIDFIPPIPKVAVPFEVKYSIVNNTPLHQKLAVTMSETATTTGGGVSSSTAEGILVSGLVNGEVRMGPYETLSLRYNALATRSGRTPLPALTVVSARHKTWVIDDGRHPRSFFVMP